MKRYIVKRFIHSVFVVLGVATFAFFMLRLIPGDIVNTILGSEYTPEAAETLRHKLGLDQPLYVQYVKWLAAAVQGDLGNSLYDGQPVLQALGEALPRSLSLAFVGWAFGVAIALPVGIVSALKRNTPADYLATVLGFLGISMPSFWLGIVLMLVFAVSLQWLPAIGYQPISEGVWGWLQRLILPGLAIGAGYGAIISRQMRGSMIEVLKQPYIRTARAKGLSNEVIIAKHALQNALIPVVTVAGIQLALLLGAAVVIETVFSIRGVGRVLVSAIFNKDYPLVQGAVLLISLIFVGLNLLVDILYTFIDPRIRYDGGQ